MKLAIGKEVRYVETSSSALVKRSVSECYDEFLKDKKWIRDCIFKSIEDKGLIKYSMVDNVLYGELNLGEEVTNEIRPA